MSYAATRSRCWRAALGHWFAAARTWLRSSEMNLHEVLRGKWTDGTRPKDLYRLYVAEEPEKYLDQLLSGLDSDEKRVQSGSAELVAILSENKPELLAPYISKFIDNLDAKEPVLRWEASCTLGNLAVVDDEKQIPAVLDRMYSNLEHKSIVLANHTAQALTKIAAQNPDRAEEIVDKLIEKAPMFKKNTVGFIIEALTRLKDNDRVKPKIVAFIEPYLESEINVVAKKAKRSLKKLG